MRVAKHKFAPIPECDDSSSGRLKVSQKVICADASDFLPPSESADDFHDPHDNIHKPSHEEQVKRGACETTNEQKCDDSPSSEHGFLVSLTFAGCALHHPLPRARVAQVPFGIMLWVLHARISTLGRLLCAGSSDEASCE